MPLGTASAELARRQMARFTQHTKPDYQLGRPHQILCRFLDRLVRGEITRGMVFMPPRHGKSELVSRRLPAQFLGQFPDKNVILTSYADSLAGRMNRDCQRIIDSPAYRELYPNVRLASPGSRPAVGAVKAQRTDDLFELVGRSGSYRSAGVGGGITGMGFDLGIIDDPFKNFEESHSQTIRDKVWEWYTSTFWTRQAPGARILLTMTRWHNDDLAGRLLDAMKTDKAADQWEVLRLPAIADGDLHPEDDRKPGDALWPERFNEAWLATARASLGSYLFGGMYGQLPSPEGGNHFKEVWFKPRYFDAGDYWLVGGERFHKSDCTVFVTCDPASSNKKTADNTAIGVWCVTPHNDLLLLEVVAGRFGLTGIIPQLMAVVRQWNPGFVAVEANGFQVSIVREARRTKGMPPVRELSHEGKGKLVRATPAIILAESGKIWLPVQAPWIKPYIDEMTRFTGMETEEQDDQVDITSYAVWQMPRLARDPSSGPAAKTGHTPTEPIIDSLAGRSGLWGRK